MEKEKLIKKIMEEVKDPILRDKLLAEIVSENDVGNSLIAKELDAFGFKPDKAREFVQWEFRVGIVIGYILATFFAVAGICIMLYGLIVVNGFALLFGGIWTLVGTLGFIGNRKKHMTRSQ